MPARPWRTMTRFSSESGTMSAIVASATRPMRSHQVIAEVRRRPFAVAEALADLPGQLERHPRAAEVAAGVPAAGQARMDDHVGLRQLEPIVWWSVMISSTPSSRASSASAPPRSRNRP